MKLIRFLKFLPSQTWGMTQLLLRRAHIGNNIIFRGMSQVKGRGKIIIGDNVTINSGASASPISCGSITSIYVKSGGELKIGTGSGISSSAIYCNDAIEIGEYVMIGAGCKIIDTDFHSIYAEIRRKDGLAEAKTKPIIIGNDVFIGTNCIICKGVTIGNGSVIGAGSVVTRNIPENQIWAGNPAAFIRSIERV